jgi:hypothetical protein
MAEILHSIASYSFLVFPPILLLLKFITKKPAGGLLVLLVVLYALLGWPLIFFAYAEDQSHINELINQGRYEELPKGWDSDGGAGVGALFLGWIFPLFYFLAWSVVYAVAAIIRSFFEPKRKHTSR